MINEKLAVPLSPPFSPRMSNQTAKAEDYAWQQVQTTPLSNPAAAQPHPGDVSSLGPLQDPQPTAAEETHHARPPLRAHKSFPYALAPSNSLTHDAESANTSNVPFERLTEKMLSQGSAPNTNVNLPQATFGGSAPTSPIGRLTPHSGEGAAGEEAVEDEDLEFGTAEAGDEEERPPMTAAELRAQKRKMKRFR